MLTCNSFRQSCITSDIYLKNILQHSDESESFATTTDVELIQSEIEAETYDDVKEHQHDTSQLTTYIISEMGVNKMEIDHDYYIESSDMKVIAINDAKTLDEGTIINTIETTDEVVEDAIVEDDAFVMYEEEAEQDLADGGYELADGSDSEKKNARKRLSEQNKDLCIICGSMQSHGNLRRHMETHLGEKRRQPFACPHCDRKFINRPSFVAHVNKHIGVKPFQCNVCDKRFFGANLLRTHMYSHSTENKYACSDCNKVFRYPHYLSQHRRIHRANTVYSCEHCEYTNVYLHNYKNHLRKHTGQYRFKCEVCDKGFSRKMLYMKHVEKHTKKK